MMSKSIDADVTFLLLAAVCAVPARFLIYQAIPLASSLPPSPASHCTYGTDLHKGGLSSGDDSLARCGEMRGRAALLMIFGRGDPHVPLEGRTKIRAALDDAGLDFSWMELNGAQHAFMRDENSYGRYDPELATLTYAAAMQLFGRRLH